MPRCVIRELRKYQGLLSDYQAVVNALMMPWSNGQVEGQINKLKTIKRQMYGRAGFELLRKRVILHSAYSHQNWRRTNLCGFSNIAITLADKWSTSMFFSY